MTDNQREYETIFILDPTLEDTKVNEEVERAGGVIRDQGGTIGDIEKWGRRRLAYEIAHKSEAVYHLLLFSAPTETLDEITRVLKITDGVMRHGAYRRVKGSTSTKAPSQIPSGAPAAAAPAEDDIAAPADDMAAASE